MHVIPLLHYNNVWEMKCLQHFVWKTVHRHVSWLHRGMGNISCIIWCNWYPKVHLMRICFNLSNQNHLSPHFLNIFHVTCLFSYNNYLLLLKLHWARARRWQMTWLAYLNLISINIHFLWAWVISFQTDSHFLFKPAHCVSLGQQSWLYAIKYRLR